MASVFDDYLVTQSVIIPSYKPMKEAYEDYVDFDKAPCKFGITNQCAVRMSIALVRSGFSLDSFPRQTRIHHGRSRCKLALPHLVGAHELARHLKELWGATETYLNSKTKKAFDELKGRKGIIYFNDVFTRDNGTAGDHIDLWDGEKFYNYHLAVTVGGNSGYDVKKMFKKANKIWFFELPDDSNNPESETNDSNNTTDFGNNQSTLPEQELLEIWADEMERDFGSIDEVTLTFWLFDHRHPELNGRDLRDDEVELINEWYDIHDFLVLPLIEQRKKRTTQPVEEEADDTTYGQIRVDTSVLELKNSFPTYQFTEDDAVWLARFVKGEAGGKNNADNHAVFWAVVNRYAVFRHKVPSWGSFGDFIQKYSTTLQPILKSVGAAKRVWKNHRRDPEKYPVVTIDEHYEGTNIQKVQYKRHIDLQKTPWEDFSSTIQNMVDDLLNGKIANPGIGIASEFASTRIYYKTRHDRNPTEEQWREYTENFKTDKWTWVGDVDGINQMKNAFFIDNRLTRVPSDAVTIK